MTYQKLQTNFERELLVQIISQLRQKKITQNRAKMVAQDFLPALKSKEASEFIERLSILARMYPEIMEAFIITMKEYEKENVGENLAKVRSEFGGLS